jgi:hypothetical protein
MTGKINYCDAAFEILAEAHELFRSAHAKLLSALSGADDEAWERGNTALRPMTWAATERRALNLTLTSVYRTERTSVG